MKKDISNVEPEQHFKVEIGKRLKMLRKSLNLNQEDFAKQIGSSSISFISEIETGKESFGSDFLYSLKNKMPMVNLNWLFSGEGEMLLSPAEQITQSADQHIMSLEAAVATMQQLIHTLRQQQGGEGS